MADSTPLFDGSTLRGWEMSTIRDEPGQDDPGRAEVRDGAIVTVGGTGLGLLWHGTPLPADFALTLEWRLGVPEGNSGVLLRFPDIRAKGYRNTAWVASHHGFEVQIDALARGEPPGAPKFHTGAIYDQDAQVHTKVPADHTAWNRFDIEVRGQVYTVALNGRTVTRFENRDPARGLPTTPGHPSYLGLQCYAGYEAWFRGIAVRALTE
ncbi:MAG TPA: DUF1080 domain-containing protein [Azospirillaceae bacterium]|nr:DUF1080 domain-containing protein [Azospirillaceae bacterium]